MNINDLKDWMVSKGGENVTSAYGFSNTKLRVESEHSPTYYQVDLMVTDGGDWSMCLYEYDTIDHQLMGHYLIKEISDIGKFINSVKKGTALKQILKYCKSTHYKESIWSH